MFYSKSTGGFYSVEIHGENIPVDAVEITAEHHAALIAGQAAGKRIIADESGYPILADPPLPGAAEMWERIKSERDRRSDEGGYRVGGKWYHSDQKSRSQQLGLVLLGDNLPAGVQWKTMDGSFVTMTPVLAREILAAAAASDQAIFVAAEIHKAAMEASAEPALYDFYGGWPAMFPG